MLKLTVQVEDLKWELEQRQREIDAQKQQVEMMEQCHQKELDNLQRALQVIFIEQLKMVQLLLCISQLPGFPSGLWLTKFTLCLRT